MAISFPSDGGGGPALPRAVCSLNNERAVFLPTCAVGREARRRYALEYVCNRGDRQARQTQLERGRDPG